MTEHQARQLAAELRATGWLAHAHFESAVDGHPETWHVRITKRKPSPPSQPYDLSRGHRR